MYNLDPAGAKHQIVLSLNSRNIKDNRALLVVRWFPLYHITALGNQGVFDARFRRSLRKIFFNVWMYTFQNVE